MLIIIKQNKYGNIWNKHQVVFFLKCLFKIYLER